jgi:hypothetical protein
MADRAAAPLRRRAATLHGGVDTRRPSLLPFPRSGYLKPMAAYFTVRDLRIPADVIPVRRSEFEEARGHAGTLVRTVVGEGRRIYAR